MPKLPSPQGTKGFGDRLLETISQRGRLCVGIDPHPHLMKDWGLDINAKGLETFTQICVEAFAPVAAVAKPQVAFYESFGSAGFAILERALADLSQAGVLTVADAKRGDIGSTMRAYASAWLANGAPLACDALTVSPYLGFGSLKPAVELARQTGRGLFVLAATSNPEGASVQQAHIAGRDIQQSMVDQAAELNRVELNQGAIVGSFGVVVGATLKSAPALDQLHGPILMPGVGAQGATAADVDRLAGESRRVALPNISRAILATGPDIKRLRSAVIEASRDFPVE